MNQLLLRKATMSKKQKKMKGTVQKVIKAASPKDTEKAQIALADADHLYREIRVENVVFDEEGHKAALRPGAEVDVVIEADSEATFSKPDDF